MLRPHVGGCRRPAGHGYKLVVLSIGHEFGPALGQGSPDHAQSSWRGMIMARLDFMNAINFGLAGITLLTNEPGERRRI
jgi:hypothetical protein